MSCRLIGAIIILLTSGVSEARSQDVQARAESSTVVIQLIVESERVRFTTSGPALEWRLEIADQQGQLVFDSASVIGTSVDWLLVDRAGQAVESGLYAYALTVRAAGSDVQVRRGRFQISRLRSLYQIRAVDDDVPAGASLALPVLDANEGQPEPGSSLSGWSRRSFDTVSFGPQPYISGTGTTGRMTRWSDGPNAIVADSQIAEVDGNMVVGNGTFTGNVHIFGASNNDVFAGMGPDVAIGPAFNFGYAGASFGRSAGFFNVRPDASATPPNPSLRFMTANVERMIVTNAGDVGIGTPSPGVKLHVAGTEAHVRLETTSSSLFSATEYATPSKTWQTGIGGASVANGLNDKYFITDSGIIRLVIDGLGRVGIGTSTPTSRLHVLSPTGAVRGTADGGPGVIGTSSTGNGVEGSSISGYAGYFTGNVYVTGTVTQNSDRRLKDRIAPLEYGLRDVMRLRPVTWHWNDRPDNGRQLGLIAQEVESVIPDLVARASDERETLGLNYAGLVPVVINAIKEQQAIIDNLQAENDALRARLAAIEIALEARRKPAPRKGK